MFRHSSDRQRIVELTLVTNSMTKDNKWELNMTRKYMVESSTIVRKMLGRPSCSDNPAPDLKLT